MSHQAFTNKYWDQSWKSFKLTPAVCQKFQTGINAKYSKVLYNAILLVSMKAYGFYEHEYTLSQESVALVITALSDFN